MMSLGVGFVVGGLGGALSAFLGWNASGESFIAKKFIAGLATGIIAGISLVFVNLQGFKAVTDDFTLIALYGTILAGALGMDFLRARISDAIINKTTEETTAKPVSGPTG